LPHYRCGNNGGVYDILKLKGKSPYVLRRDFWESVRYKLWGNHFWSPSYCVVSCGGASLDIVKAHIEQQ